VTGAALASGPVATVLQDLLSVATDLSTATLILRWSCRKEGADVAAHPQL
jgi:hypothetical protein